MTESALHPARALRERGEHERAIALLDDALAAAPDDATLLSERGLCFCELGRTDEALADFTRSFELAPSYPAAYNAGNMHLDRGRDDAALAMFDASVACFDGYPEAWVNRGIALYRLGRAAEGVASFDRALAVDGAFLPALRCKAMALEALGRKGDSEALYARVVELSPGDVRALADLGMALSRLPPDNHMELEPHGREWRALETLNAVIEQAPDHRGAWAAKAEVLFRSMHANVAFRTLGPPDGINYFTGPLRHGSFRADLLAVLDAALARFPGDPYFVELKSEIG